MPERLPLSTLPVVDGCALEEEVRSLLRPGELLEDTEGRLRVLPRFFYRVDSWDIALNVRLAEHFMLWEFLSVDVREAQPLIVWPRYVPCAVTLFATHLELFRRAVGTVVHIAANGGYRSPSHRESRGASLHCWGTAANIYRIGDEYVNEQASIERYSALAREVSPAFWARPWGRGDGLADDHLHLDIGYAVLLPREAGSDPSAGAPELIAAAQEKA